MGKWILLAIVVAAAALAAAFGLRGHAEAPSEAVDAAVSCTVVRPPTRLPPVVRETSGLAYGSTGVLWTHNDAGGRPEIYGFDDSGRQVARVAVTGAGFSDWEDIDAAPCSDGACLFIGDIGDNDAARDHITVYRVPEPPAGATAVPATAFHGRYPEGPQDAEGLIALPDGSMYVVTKGTHGPIRLYRFPSDPAPGVVQDLTLVRELAPRAGRRGNWMTAATASRDGRWIAMRSYDTLYVFEARSLLGAAQPEPAATFDLRALREPQGEGLALDADGGVWLTSEAEGGGEPFLTGLSCPYGG